MKRAAWILLPLVAVGLGTWLAGRPPTRYVLEEECRRFLDERKEREEVLQFRIAKAQKRNSADLAELQRDLDELYRTPKRLRVRGWEVVLIPAGGRRPEPADFLDVGTHDPSTHGDPALLRGPMRIWLAPRSWLARRFSRG